MNKRILKKFGKLKFSEWLQIFLHPFLIPFTMIPAWSKSLWNSRILLWGQWSRFHGFHASNAINSLFYRTQWININRYGRLGKSPIVGLGNFPLSNWWYLSALASYFYANAGAVTTLLGTLFLVFSHLIWLQSTNCIWVLVVTFLFLFSSTSYCMAFARQNYQILAWMFLPIGMFGLLNDQLVIGGMAFFLTGMLGITAFVVGAYLVFIHVIYSADYQLLWVMMPATLIASVKLLSLVFNRNWRESILSMGKLIGLIHVKVRYKRKSMRFGLFNLYCLFLYGIALSLMWIAKQELPIYMMAAFLLFLINQRFLRFADDQSVVLTVAMSGMLEALLEPFNWVALAGLILAINPILKSFQVGSYAVPKIFKPLDVNGLLDKLTKFLCLPSGSRVLFAFEDPEGEYEKIFDGYRILVEAPLVVAAEKEIHLFPDWYAVFETNYDGAPPIWGRSVKEVMRNLNFWNTDFVVVYQDSATHLSFEWLDKFEVISVFEWLSVLDNQMVKEIIGDQKKPPKWWLLKLRSA